MLKRLLQDPTFAEISIRGLPVRLQASFLLLPLWAAAVGILTGAERGRSAVFMVAFVLLLYICAALHEIGHILPARAFGAVVTYVRISGMGAFVHVESAKGITPRQDFLIAVGGPLVSALLSVVLCAIAWPLWQAQGLVVLIQRNAPALLVTLAGTNILLTIFNLLPVFPMDGGRALNALLAFYLRPARAGQMVAVFGQIIAVALAASMAFLTAHLFIRIAALVTAGLIFLVSYRAGQTFQLAPQKAD